MAIGKHNLSLCGASGAVGQEILRLLEERSFPVSELRLFGSEQSAGETMAFRDEEIPIRLLNNQSFNGTDIALFATTEKISKRYAPLAIEEGAIVVDVSGEFRKEPDVPLVVAEVNPKEIALVSNQNIIASPGAVAVSLAKLLKPLEEEVRVYRVVVSALYPASSMGRKGVRELESQSLALFNMRDVVCECFKRQIAFNCLPCTSKIFEDGTSEEEQRIALEVGKVLNRLDLKLSVTAIQVPVFYGQSEVVNIEFESQLQAQRAEELLSRAPGVIVVDSQEEPLSPASFDAIRNDDVLVGRIREDRSVQHGLVLFVVADNIRNGSALNAVQIAEILVKDYM